MDVCKVLKVYIWLALLRQHNFSLQWCMDFKVTHNTTVTLLYTIWKLTVAFLDLKLWIANWICISGGFLQSQQTSVVWSMAMVAICYHCHWSWSYHTGTCLERVIHNIFAPEYVISLICKCDWICENGPFRHKYTVKLKSYMYSIMQK